MKVLGLLVTMLCVSWPVHAQPVDHRPAFRVTYGVLLDGKEPKAGSAYCSSDKTCTLINDADVQLNLRMSSGLSGGAELSVICRPIDCSFSGRMPRVTVRDHSTLYLVQGRDFGVVHDLVARINRTVGSVRLDIRKAP
ncbi:hypothetical protein J2X71_002637 [Rhizobium sp. 1399]|jgi:hypothetical protein|nr:hypothetical protein [Rhizobium sp. 1399]